MIQIGNGPFDGGGLFVDTWWLNATWVFTEPPPTGLAQSWEIAFFTGSDPTIAANHVVPLSKLPIAARQHEVSVDYPKGKAPPTINCAIRTVYPWANGPWVNATATVTPVAPTYPTALGDNLIPNPTSEMGLATQGYGAVLMVNDSPNSYAGNWCRKLDTSATNATALTDKIPCIYGDQISYSAYIKTSSVSCAVQLLLTFYNASGTSVGTATSTAYSATTYAYSSVQGTVPVGAIYVVASVQASTTAAATFGYFDNLSLRRSINFGHLTADAGFRTLNALKNTGATVNDRTWYAGNNDSTVKGGAPNISTLTITRRRWNSPAGTARLELKLQPTAASDNLDGMRPAKVLLYRQDYLPALSGTINASITVGGNTTLTRNSGGSGSFITDGFVVGATVTVAGFANGANNGSFTLNGTVTATTIQWSNTGQVTESNRAGVTVSVTPVLTTVDTFYPQIHDRLFANATDSNAANASINSMAVSDAGISGGYPAALVTLYNAFGPSDTHCFYSAVGNADGVALADNGTAFPATFSGGSSGGSGGGAGGGGGCPQVDVLVDIAIQNADGTITLSQKRAGDIVVGDLAWTEDPNTGTVGQWPFTEATLEAATGLWKVNMVEAALPKNLAFLNRHRLRTTQGWTEVQDLQPGDRIVGTVGGTVASIAPAPDGNVMRLSVDQVHSYQTSGLLSSNIKPQQ